MKDYTKELGFWKRLESFVSDVQTGCCAGEEEKQMIIHNCKLKILDIQRVSNSVCDLNPDFQQYLIEQGETKCKQCGKKLKAK
jgi:hypothetical protein